MEPQPSPNPVSRRGSWLGGGNIDSRAMGVSRGSGYASGHPSAAWPQTTRPFNDEDREVSLELEEPLQGLTSRNELALEAIMSGFAEGVSQNPSGSGAQGPTSHAVPGQNSCDVEMTEPSSLNARQESVNASCTQSGTTRRPQPTIDAAKHIKSYYEPGRILPHGDSPFMAPDLASTDEAGPSTQMAATTP